MSGETPAERKEAAATRRRWVTLAEVVAVAGVVIAALTLWNSWSERSAQQAEKAAERSSEDKAKARIDLGATVQDSGQSLLLKDARYDIQDVAVTFPRAIGVATKRPPADPVIEAGWFKDELLKLTDGGADDRAGRMPVLLTVRYFDGERTREASGIYDIIWRTHGRRFLGRALELEGMRVNRRGGTQADLDAVWAREKP